MNPQQQISPQPGGLNAAENEFPPLKLTEEEREELLRELTEEIELIEDRLDELIEEANLEIEDDEIEDNVGQSQLAHR